MFFIMNVNMNVNISQGPRSNNTKLHEAAAKIYSREQLRALNSLYQWVGSNPALRFTFATFTLGGWSHSYIT